MNLNDKIGLGIWIIVMLVTFLNIISSISIMDNQLYYACYDKNFTGIIGGDLTVDCSTYNTCSANLISEKGIFKFLI